MTKLISVNPSTKEKLGEVAITTKKQVLTKIAKAKTAFSSWGYLELNKRIGNTCNEGNGHAHNRQ